MSDRIEKAAMVSDETIEKAVEVVWECGPWTDQESLRIARALAEAGLLAPAPLRAMYAEGMKHPDFGWLAAWDKTFADPETVRERLAGDPGTVIRRYVSDWEQVEP